MKYFIYLLFLFQACQFNTNIKPKIVSNKIAKFNELTQEDYAIDSIDKKSIGTKIKELNKIKQLKDILKRSFDRQTEKPYMWDIFASSNESMLEFYNYSFFIIKSTKFKSYYVKINYEDANFKCVLLVNENLYTEYNSMIVYEELQSEEKYLRTTQIIGDKLYIIFKSPNPVENLSFQIKDGMFLDFFEIQKIDKKWGDKKILNSKENFEYQLKGETNNHFKNGYWIEKRYSLEYGKSIIQDGSYINGLRDGDWNFSPDGPVDVIRKFDKGRFISESYP